MWLEVYLLLKAYVAEREKLAWELSFLKTFCYNFKAEGSPEAMYLGLVTQDCTAGWDRTLNEKTLVGDTVDMGRGR